MQVYLGRNGIIHSDSIQPTSLIVSCFYQDLLFFLKLLILNRYAHPINGEECPVVIGGDYITTESGTGLVHTAPGHGQDDYITGLKYNLPIISPVDDEGKFTKEAGIFKGLDVLGDGNAAVIDHLDQLSSIIMVEPYSKLVIKTPLKWFNIKFT